MDDLIGQNYKLVKKIGQGSFGRIYIAEDVRDRQRYAVKLENTDAPIPQLLFESRIYSIMSGSINVPRMYYHGVDLNYNVIVVDLLGKSLEDLLNMLNRKMSLKTVLMLADQMLTSIEFFHTKNYIHRDLKPDNFVIGTGKNYNKLYIIDFGLAKKYRDQVTHQHILYSSRKSLTGTARYASINALTGIEQSRRDDMESLGYVFVYLLKGELPWMGCDGFDRRTRYQNIAKCKQNTKLEDLCKDLPREFIYYLDSVRNLEFDEKPDYEAYRRMFRKLFIKKGYVYDYQYDWMSLPYYKLLNDLKEKKGKERRTRKLRKPSPRNPIKFTKQNKSIEVMVSGEFEKRSEENLKTIDFDFEEKEMPEKPVSNEQIDWIQTRRRKEFVSGDFTNDTFENTDDFIPIRKTKKKEQKLPPVPKELKIIPPKIEEKAKTLDENEMLKKNPDNQPLKRRKKRKTIRKKNQKKEKEKKEEFFDENIKPNLTIQPETPQRPQKPSKEVNSPLLKAFQSVPKTYDEDIDERIEQNPYDSAEAMKFAFLEKEAEKFALEEVKKLDSTPVKHHHSHKKDTFEYEEPIHHHSHRHHHRHHYDEEPKERQRTSRRQHTNESKNNKRKNDSKGQIPTTPDFRGQRNLTTVDEFLMRRGIYSPKIL